MAAGIDMIWRNYVTVTLCIVLRLGLFCDVWLHLNIVETRVVVVEKLNCTTQVWYVLDFLHPKGMLVCTMFTALSGMCGYQCIKKQLKHFHVDRRIVTTHDLFHKVFIVFSLCFVLLPCHWCTVTTHHNRFTALFPGPTGWAGARRELLDFMVQGKINRGRHTDHMAGRHYIRTKQCPPPASPMFFTGRMPFLLPNQQCQSTEGCNTV